MLAAFFDESGTDGASPHVAVGGYVAPLENWASYEVEWRQFLSDFRIEHFHTTDMLSQKKEFSEEFGWSKRRVKQALSVADEIINRHALFGITSYANIEACEAAFPLKERKRGKKFADEYALASITVVSKVCKWAQRFGYSNPISFIFEDGAKGKGIVMEVLDHWKKNEFEIAYLMGTWAFGDKERLPQLHSADKLINFTSQALNRYIGQGAHGKGDVEKLIKAKLHEVWRWDAETIPELKVVAKELLITTGLISDTGLTAD